jgi:6-phosphofructokinase 1
MDIKTRVVPIETLGEARHDSPLVGLLPAEAGMFSRDSTRVIGDVVRKEETEPLVELFERAGQRQRIYFDPPETRVGVVTCGGLCPGLNNVIRSLVLELFHRYGMQRMFGFRFGYQGLNPDYGYEPTPLHPDVVDGIENIGGTILGSSRGNQDPVVMVDTLLAYKINILFCIGGDGTQRGAHAIADEVRRRRLPIAIVGIPKTIDNDIAYCDRSFGYATAINEAKDVLDAAHVEAKGAFNGVGLVKLMGREAGFIAAGATVASQEANCTLIPELSFALEGGQTALLPWLTMRLNKRKHAVIVVAEGAGQSFFEGGAGTDASGNKLHHDIGLFLKGKMEAHLNQQKVPVAVKYIDPSYIIRSVPANSEDAVLCDQFARMAAHAAMAGKTNLVVGLLHGQFVHVPIAMVTSQKKRLDVGSPLWRAVLASTGQPAVMR